MACQGNERGAEDLSLSLSLSFSVERTKADTPSIRRCCVRKYLQLAPASWLFTADDNVGRKNRSVTRVTQILARTEARRKGFSAERRANPGGDRCPFVILPCEPRFSSRRRTHFTPARICNRFARVCQPHSFFLFFSFFILCSLFYSLLFGAFKLLRFARATCTCEFIPPLSAKNVQFNSISGEYLSVSLIS